MQTKPSMKKSLASILAASFLFLGGCKEYRTQYSEVKQEDAVVTERYHRSARMHPVMVGKVRSFVHHPAINRTTFDGVVDFTINSRELYERFNEKDNALVFYRESYRETYEDINKDGQKELINKEFSGFEFIDAQKSTNSNCLAVGEN
jgi:hypothetical protein